MDTNILKEHAFSMIRVKVSRMRMQLGYVCRLYGRWSYSSRGEKGVNLIWLKGVINRKCEKNDLFQGLSMKGCKRNMEL
jgi:hypothetical protein